jgi:hypothetical protein
MEWSGFALLILVGVGIISTGLPARLVRVAVLSTLALSVVIVGVGGASGFWPKQRRAKCYPPRI